MDGRRKEPYTARGIRRLPCARCGRRAEQQWSACVLGNVQIPLCRPCDLDLNDLLLRWLGLPKDEADALMVRYAHALDTALGAYENWKSEGRRP